MGGFGVKHGPNLNAATRPSNSPTAWVATAVAVVIGIVLVVFGRGLFVQWLEPGFEVVEIHSSERTMTLRRANHNFLVRCDDACGRFEAGHSYRMDLAGDHIQYHSSGQNISLPILEEEVGYTTPGGRG